MRASLVNQLRVLVPVKRTIDYGKFVTAYYHAGVSQQVVVCFVVKVY